MTWQPISTAPRDGTPVLAYYEKSGRFYEVHWQKDSRRKSGGAWVNHWYLMSDFDFWTPLPAPPVTTTEAERIAVMDGK